MKHFPETVFVNKPSDIRGGGIDYLGLRLVNLTIIGSELLPGLNNVTVDMGMFWLGAWIPWKFHQLADRPDLCTEDQYRIFREKIEVAVAASYSLLDARLRNQIGVGQKLKADAEFSFKNVNRSDSTSMYAAPLYGPAFQYLKFIRTYYSQGVSGNRAVRIPHVGQEREVLNIIQRVDAELRKSIGYHTLASLNPNPLSLELLEDLALHGLNPARFRDQAFNEGHHDFLHLAFPLQTSDDGYKRTLSGKLMVQSIGRYPESTTNDLRMFWYTGMDASGKQMEFEDDEVSNHAKVWRVLLARQYQRYGIELFLRSFEQTILAGCQSMADCVQYTFPDLKALGWEALTLGAVFEAIAGECLSGEGRIQTSRNWNRMVISGSDRFELPDTVDKEHGVLDALKLLGGWFWRNRLLLEDEKLSKFTQMGGAERMSMKWFCQWIEKRWDVPVSVCLQDVFQDLVFEQHLQVALSREDGKSERIRFHTGDRGLEQSYAKHANFGRLGLGFTPDRLDTMLALLLDTHVLREESGKISLGRNAGYFTG